jgi:hypothetical protein
VIGNELGHFEHGHLGFAAEYSFQLVVGVDHAAVGRILQVELLDVIPDFFRHFGAWQRAAPTTAASTVDGVIAFMNAAFGLRGAAGAAAFFTAGLAAAAGFAGAAFFAAAGFAAGAAAFLAGAAAGVFLAVAIFEPP